MEIVAQVFWGIVAVAGGIITIWGAVKLIKKLFRWLRSWTFIKRDKLAELEEIKNLYEKLRQDKPFGTAVESALLKNLKELRETSKPQELPPFETRTYFDPRKINK